MQGCLSKISLMSLNRHRVQNVALLVGQVVVSSLFSDPTKKKNTSNREPILVTSIPLRTWSSIVAAVALTDMFLHYHTAVYFDSIKPHTLSFCW